MFQFNLFDVRDGNSKRVTATLSRKMNDENVSCFYFFSLFQLNTAFVNYNASNCSYTVQQKYSTLVTVFLLSNSSNILNDSGQEDFVLQGRFDLLFVDPQRDEIVPDQFALLLLDR